MADKKRIDVIFCGKILTLVGEEPEAYMHSIADYVDKQIKELSKPDTLRKIGQELVNVLVAVHITDQLFKEREKIKAYEEELERKEAELQQKNIFHEKCLVELGATQAEAMALKDKLIEIQLEVEYYKQKLFDTTQELSSLRKEFDTYIETMEENKKEEQAPKNQKPTVEQRYERKKHR